MVGLISFMFLHCSVQPNPDKEHVPNERFKTTQPSRLYFNNMRSVSYDSERKGASKMDVYQLRSFSKTKDRPIIYPAIVDNWMKDEAYVFVQQNDYDAFADTLRVFWSKGEEEGVLELLRPTMLEQQSFATSIYEKLAEGNDLRVATTSGTQAIFKDRQDRNNFMTVMKDYYRLIEQE